MDNISNKEKILLQLNKIVENLKQNTEKEDIAKLSELLINYKFHKQMTNDSNDSDEYSDKDMIRFLSLGWYVYTNLIPSN